MKCQINHKSSISNAVWISPVGWEPINSIDGAFVDGAWWDEVEEVAGIVAFNSEGNEGDVIDVPLEDLRIVSTGDCKVIGEIEVDLKVEIKRNY